MVVKIFLNLIDGSDKVFHKFLLKSLFKQLILLVFLSSLLFSYIYFEWTKAVQENRKNIEMIMGHNFSRYHQMIDMMQAKMKTQKSDIHSILNTKKYNMLLSCGKTFIDASSSYLVRFKGDVPIVISEYGIESFASVPENSFFDSFKTEGETKIFLNKNLIFIAKLIGTEFIALKIDANEIISVILAKTDKEGHFNFYLNNSNDSTTPLFNLNYNYQPISFIKFTRQYSSYLYLGLTLFLLFSFSWIMNLLKFHKTELVKRSLTDKKSINQLNEKVKYLEDYNAKLDYSADILSNIYSHFFVPKNNETEAIKQINLSKIISDCRSILYKQLNERKVNCEVSILNEQTIGAKLARPIYVLLINYIYRAIDRTPYNETVFVKIKRTKGLITVIIQDCSFNIKGRDEQNQKPIFYLPENELNEYAAEFNIGLLKKHSSQNYIVELYLPEKEQLNTANLDGKENVIMFPGKSS